MKYFFLKTWGNIDIKHILKFIQIRDVPNDFQYARMTEEELLLQSLFYYSKFQREVEQKTYMKEQLNQELELESNNTMSDEEKIELINLKYEKDIQKKIDNLTVLYKNQSDKELDAIRFENTDL